MKKVKILVITLLFLLPLFIVPVFGEYLVSIFIGSNSLDTGNGQLRNVHPSGDYQESGVVETFFLSGCQNITVIYQLTTVTFYLEKYLSPTGFLQAQLFEITGTFGTNSKPTGSALCGSSFYDSSLLSSVAYNPINFTFSGSNIYNMSTNHYYAIALICYNNTFSQAVGRVFYRHSGSVVNGFWGEMNYYSYGTWNLDITHELKIIMYGNVIIKNVFSSVDISNSYLSGNSTGFLLGNTTGFNLGNQTGYLLGLSSGSTIEDLYSYFVTGGLIGLAIGGLLIMVIIEKRRK